ncbi:hypothetical protein Tco_0490544 [Tanacetum coccineum]
MEDDFNGKDAAETLKSDVLPLEGFMRSSFGMAWKFKENLKLRGSLFHSWKIRFEDVHVLKVKIRLLFVLSSSNRGRLLGFTDLMIQKAMIQKNKRMKQ